MLLLRTPVPLTYHVLTTYLPHTYHLLYLARHAPPSYTRPTYLPRTYLPLTYHLPTTYCTLPGMQLAEYPRRAGHPPRLLIRRGSPWELPELRPGGWGWRRGAREGATCCFVLCRRGDDVKRDWLCDCTHARGLFCMGRVQWRRYISIPDRLVRSCASPSSPGHLHRAILSPRCCCSRVQRSRSRHARSSPRVLGKRSGRRAP